jgi:hypothetical protein
MFSKKAMVLMRYSYFGFNRRMRASRNASRDQTDPDFDLVVRGSEGMADQACLASRSTASRKAAKLRLACAQGNLK